MCHLASWRRDGPGVITYFHRLGDDETFAAGTDIFHRGDIPSRVFFLRRGQVVLLAGPASRRAVVEIVERPGLLHIAPAVLGAQALVTATALQPTRVLSIATSDFLELLHQDSGFSSDALTVMARDLRSLIRQITDLKARPVAQRLACYLLALQGRTGTGPELALPIEKRVLAARLGTTPEHLSRAFATLKPLGVQSRGARIVIGDAAALARYAAQDEIEAAAHAYGLERELLGETG